MKRWIVGLVVFALLAAAIGVASRVLPQRRAYLTDAETIKEPAATARVRDVLWAPPTRLPDPINAGNEDYEPRLSADGMTIFFVRGKAGENADIFLADRTANGWSEPRSFLDINSEADDLGPQPSANGEAIYFYSNRAGGFGGYDLWVSRRGTNGDWQAPENLGPTINSEFNDYGPGVTPDAKTLYFASNRPQPGDVKKPNPNAWSATLREDLFHRTYDLYAAAITDRGVGQAEPINTLNSPFNEGAPAVSSFGDFLYFASDRPGGAGAFDLYRSRRLRGGHEPPTSLGGAVNTEYNELDPALSMGGFGLDFSSDRPVAGRAPGESREYELYHTNSREVFAEAERIDRAPIHWAGLWAAIGPNLLWALVALSLLLLMLMLFKGVQNRKLSLLMRCLLASLVTHMLLMLLFNTWQVATALAGEFHRRGPIQIALAAPVRGDSIATQIRGGLAEFDAPPPVEVALERQHIPLTAVAEIVHADLPIEHESVQLAAPLKIETITADATVKLREPAATQPTIDPNADRRIVEVALPPDPMRESVSESDAAAHIEAIAVRSATRPQQDIPIELAIATPAATLPPQARDTDSISSSSSFALSPSIHEATPVAEPIRTYAPVPLLDRSMASMEPRLPDTPARTNVAEAPEDSAALPTESPSVVRAAPLGLDWATPPSAAVVDVKPAQMVDSSADVRLVAQSLQKLEDAPLTVVQPMGNVAAREVFAANNVDMDIKLPATPLAERTQGNVTEAAPMVEAPMAKSAHAPFRDVVRSNDLKPSPPMPLAAPLENLSKSTTLSVVDSASKFHDANVPLTQVAMLPNPTKLIDSRSFKLDLPLPMEESPDDADADRQANDSDEDAGETPIGTIRGVVTGAETGEPVRGATVQLVLSDRPPLSARTGVDGRYSMVVPPMPEFFALSASRKGFVPSTTNVDRSAFMGDAEAVVDFKLERMNRAVTATEAVPDVHHLGDDRFDGTINSQFQKQSEGSSFAATFAVDGGFLKSPIDRAELRLLVKGVQRRHRIFINNHQLSSRLDESPEDGGFGEFVAPFDASILSEGANRLRIVAAPSSDDIDDFEFVNVRVYLVPSHGADAAGL